MLDKHTAELPFAEAGCFGQGLHSALLVLLDGLKHFCQWLEIGEVLRQGQLPLQERLDEGNACLRAIRFEHTSFERLEIGISQAVEIDIVVREELTGHFDEQMEGIRIKEDHDHL